MTPYGSLFFFYIIFLLTLPAIFLGMKGKLIKKYGIVLNLLMLVIIFGSSRIQSLCILAFYLGEVILVFTYIRIKKIYNARWILWIMVLFSLIPLLLVKGSNYILNKQIGFLGVSYLTFKVIQILIETYDGLITEMKFIDFTYFLLFFPSITSGPIDRSRKFIKEVNNKIEVSDYKKLLKEGVFKLSKGILYKFIISALISINWVNKIPQGHTILNTVNYMYGYSFYLFFDFAGYSLMAVGLSYILGVRTPDNFNLPFISKDIKDFWNRWHISLSFWFRDFIYTRFVMSSLKKGWFKSRYTASYIGYIITMGTMGLWHGLEKYYIIYGLYHALLIIGTDFFQRKSKWYKSVKKKDSWNIVFIFVTFNLVCFGFLIFSGYLFKK